MLLIINSIALLHIILLSFGRSDQVEDDGVVVRCGDRRGVFIVVAIVASAAAASVLHSEISAPDDGAVVRHQDRHGVIVVDIIVAAAAAASFLHGEISACVLFTSPRIAFLRI
jgi:hypothetical protein